MNKLSKHLLAIYPTKFKTSQIVKLKKNNPNLDRLFENTIPNWGIDIKRNIIYEPRNYFQFTSEFDKEEEFILFNVDNCDHFLEEEISNGGLFEKGSTIISKESEDFNVFIDIVTNKFGASEYGKHLYSTPQYLVIQINYFGGQYPDYEWDVETEIVGYMKNNIEFVELEKQRI